MSDDTEKDAAAPSHQPPKKPSLRKLENLFSDLEIEEQIPEPHPQEPGLPDANVLDAAPADPGVLDTSVMDSGVPQTGVSEIEISDAGVPKIGVPAVDSPEIPPLDDDLLLETQIHSQPEPEEAVIAEREETEESQSNVQPPSPPATITHPIKNLGVRAGTLPTDQDEEAEQILPAANAMTPIVWESLKEGRPIAEDAQPDQSAMLAYARPISGIAPLDAAGADEEPDIASVPEITQFGEGIAPQALLLEILDQDPDRIWSEDELALVQQVTDQLTLALENARLFQESRSSAEQLAILNEMSRNLSTQLEVEDVLETIYRYTSRLINAANFFVAFYNAETNEIAFPLTIEEQERVQWSTRTLGEGLVDRVIRSREPLLIEAPLQEDEERVSQGAKEKRETTERQPVSWLGVPMSYSDQVIGVITVQSYSQAQLYDTTHRDLLVAIASQAAVAIQNARLFGQTQSALQALEVGERYQKGVAQAASVLTERGITALSDVLQILGKAARSSRVLYVETQVDQRGVYWRLISEWRLEDLPSQFNNPALRRFSTSWLPSWFDDLRRNGFITMDAQSATPEGKEFLDTLGARSFVLLSVPGRHEDPGFIGFEQADYDRVWGMDEIAALRTAASALSNSLAREDLFTQVQLNLSETEAMYQASANLNAATDYSSILNVLRQHTILGHANVSGVTINLFDKPWSDWPNVTDRPDWLNSIAHWSALIGGSPEQNQAQVEGLHELSLSAWKAGERLLHPDRPIVVMDISTDPGFDEADRVLYANTLGARGILSVPLNVTGRWIGQIIAIFRQITAYTEQDARRLTSLTGQAAIAIESIRLVEETRQRNEELATINQIIGAASRTLELDQVLPEVLDLVLRTTEFESGLFSIVDANIHRLQLAVHQNMPEEIIHRLIDKGMEGTACDLVYQSGRTIHLPDILDLPQDLESWRGTFEGLKNNGFHSYLGVPLTSKGVVLGTICTFSYSPKTVSPQRLSLIEAIGRQIGVVVDNAHAYELSQRAVVEISEAERLKTQFLANMSHELRTPLNSIIGFSRVILKGIDGPINELQSQDLTAIYNSGQHLLGLINDVLDLSKIEAGKMELSFEEKVNLEEIINSAMSTIIGLVKDKPIDLKVEVEPGLPRLSIDPMKIRQVLLNLLSNAAKFTEKGSITVKAGQHTSPDGQPEVKVQVIDTGSGIGEDEQQKLFQPFSQVDGSPTRRTGGSGLGLSICQALVRLHNGQIGLESQKGKGSTFYFTLPVNPPEHRERLTQDIQSRNLDWGTAPLAYNPIYSAYHPAVLNEQLSETGKGLGSLDVSQEGMVEILAIDQDPQVIGLYRRYLVGQECSVTGITELEAAVEAARNAQPFVILLDVTMKSPPDQPGEESLDGWIVLQTLKSDPETKDIPVVICSIQVDPDKAHRMGASDYLLKPILEEDLIQVIQDMRRNTETAGASG